MSVKEFKQYEYCCDICGTRVRRDTLPKNWYQLDVSVKRNEATPLSYDNVPVDMDKIRTVAKVFHTCPDCSTVRFTVVPQEMEQAVSTISFRNKEP